MHFGKILRRTMYLTEKNDFSKAKLNFFSFLFYILSFSICFIQAVNPKEFDDESRINQERLEVEASSLPKMVTEMTQEIIDMKNTIIEAIHIFLKDKEMYLKKEITKEEFNLKKENLDIMINRAIETFKGASYRILYKKVTIIRNFLTRPDEDIFLKLESNSYYTVDSIKKIAIDYGFGIMKDLKEYKTVSLEEKEQLFAKMESKHDLVFIRVKKELSNRQEMLSLISKKILKIKKSQLNYENSGFNIEKIEELHKILENQEASFKKVHEEAENGDEKFHKIALKFSRRLKEGIKSPLFNNKYVVSMFHQSIEIYLLAYYEILANNYSFLKEHQANSEIIITNKTKEYEDFFDEKFKELKYDPEYSKECFAELIDQFKASLVSQTKLTSFMQYTYQLLDLLKMFPTTNIENKVFCQFFEPLFKRLENVQLLEFLENLKYTEDSNLEIYSDKLDAIANSLLEINNELAVSIQITNNLFNAERNEATKEDLDGIEENKEEKEKNALLNYHKNMERLRTFRKIIIMLGGEVKETLVD